MEDALYLLGMTPIPTEETSCLVDELARVAHRHPVDRKLLVAPNHAAGRELLRRLALSGRGWIGFEVTTPHRLAHRVALAEVERRDLSVMDGFEQQALLDLALDKALAAERGGLVALSEGVGFREKVHGAVTALRLAHVGPRELDAARFSQWEKKLFLLRVLQRYERLLTERRKADPAGVLSLALGVLDAAGIRAQEALGAEHILMLPELGARGLVGRFVSALGTRGAKVLPTDPVMGLDAPPSVLWGRCGPPSAGSYLRAVDRAPAEVSSRGPELFSAASAEAELREVLRRIVAAGLAWDEVEIVTPDPAAYGSTLHALATRLGIPVTYAVGLPIGRTRTGRVVRSYLDWIEEGFQADPIRRLLEAGDLRPRRSKGDHAPAALARRFRALRIGWGRKRYRAQIRQALDGLDRVEQRRGDPQAFQKRQERARGELEALRSILYPALKATPTVPDRMDDEAGPVSPAELARGLETFLRRVPRGRGPDRVAREDVSRILQRIQATLTRRTEFRSAVTILRRHLDLRVRPEIVGDDPDGAGAPWSSAGGALHLSDFEHGGFAGRTAVFVVGLDADRVPGNTGQDPVLLDSDRRVLGGDLPTSSELLKEHDFRLAAFFARLRGRVTLSYSAWQATEARTLAPSSLLLHALRLRHRDPRLTYEDLRRALAPVVGAVPPPSRPPLDSDDVWMAALGSGPVLRHGAAAVRAGYPRLDGGLVAAAQRSEGRPGAVHGVVSARPELLDPRRNDQVVVSASRLEDLGACPLRYLHKSVLRIYPPDDPELDPDRWLDALRRGGLLHEVYDTALRTAAERGIKPDEADFEALALESLSVGVARMRDEVPSPGLGTLAREEAQLREDVRSFVRMIRGLQPRSVAFELRFGLGDDDPVVIDLAGGGLRVRGAIDRVDSDLAGLHVIDYKTGSTYGYGKEPFKGGRRLQHAIYAHAAEQRLQGEVVDGQYHFPTRKGQNQTFVYPRALLTQAGELVDLMLDGVAAGHFVPTDDPDDCTFCDFAAVCRVSKEEFRVHSPLAEWSRERTNTGLEPSVAALKKTRGFE